MLQEPLLVVAAFYILFFTVIVYVRLDFSITKVPPGRLHAALALRLSGAPLHPHPRLWPRLILNLGALPPVAVIAGM